MEAKSVDYVTTGRLALMHLEIEHITIFLMQILCGPWTKPTYEVPTAPKKYLVCRNCIMAGRDALAGEELESVLLQSLLHLRMGMWLYKCSCLKVRINWSDGFHLSLAQSLKTTIRFKVICNTRTVWCWYCACWHSSRVDANANYANIFVAFSHTRAQDYFSVSAGLSFSWWTCVTKWSRVSRIVRQFQYFCWYSLLHTQQIYCNLTIMLSICASMAVRISYAIKFWETLLPTLVTCIWRRYLQFLGIVQSMLKRCV